MLAVKALHRNLCPSCHMIKKCFRCSLCFRVPLITLHGRAVVCAYLIKLQLVDMQDNKSLLFHRADKIPSNLYSTYLQACHAMKEKVLQGKKCNIYLWINIKCQFSHCCPPKLKIFKDLWLKRDLIHKNKCCVEVLNSYSCNDFFCQPCLGGIFAVPGSPVLC